jgi:hypothetical protein
VWLRHVAKAVISARPGSATGSAAEQVCALLAAVPVRQHVHQLALSFSHRCVLVELRDESAAAALLAYHESIPLSLGGARLRLERAHMATYCPGADDVEIAVTMCLRDLIQCIEQEAAAERTRKPRGRRQRVAAARQSAAPSSNELHVGSCTALPSACQRQGLVCAGQLDECVSSLLRYSFADTETDSAVTGMLAAA